MSEFEKRLAAYKTENEKLELDPARVPAGLTDAAALSRVRFPYAWGVLSADLAGVPES